HAGGGHVGGGPRASVPSPGVRAPSPRISAPISRAGVSRPGMAARGVQVFPQGLRFRVASPLGRPIVHGRFFRFVPVFGINSFFWSCAPFWGWSYGCNQLPVYPSSYASGFENYVTIENYPSPTYLYVPEGRDLVWLYLKDGSAYAVYDYWFVGGEVHFNAVAEGGMRSAEQVIGLDEL